MNMKGELDMGETGKTIVYVVVSLLVSITYFTLIDHFLMDMQGLDYWYLFRK